MNRAQRRADPTTWLQVVQGSRVIDPDLADKVMLRVHAALDELRTGRAQGKTADQLMHILANTINSAVIRAEQIDRQLEAPINAAVEAMQRADERRATHGHYGFDGPGLSAIRTALDVYEEILRNSSEKQMIDAEAVARRRANEQYRQQLKEGQPT